MDTSQLVDLFLWNHTSYPTKPVSCVALSPRDHLPMGMHHRLTGRRRDRSHGSCPWGQPTTRNTADFEGISLPLMNPWEMDGQPT